MSITYNPSTRIARTVLNMTGMSQRGAAVAVVLDGTCSAPGGVAWRGARFVADANGRVNHFVVVYGDVNGVPTNHVVAIQTVQGRNEPRTDYLLACGPVQTTGAHSGSVTLGSAPGVTNGNVTGRAQLSQANGALTITVQASGMFHNTAYATSLNLGSCEWLSDVLYDLPQMHADGDGNGSVTITINNAEPLSASNNWYIAIDYSSTLNRDHFMPMSCGNVVVSASS
jgi:hypothetical protein